MFPQRVAHLELIQNINRRLAQLPYANKTNLSGITKDLASLVQSLIEFQAFMEEREKAMAGPNYVPVPSITRRLRYGELPLGQCFITFPVGDRKEHEGGFLGSYTLFKKVGPTLAFRLSDGMSTTCADHLEVIHVEI